MKGPFIAFGGRFPSFAEVASCAERNIDEGVRRLGAWLADQGEPGNSPER